MGIIETLKTLPNGIYMISDKQTGSMYGYSKTVCLINGTPYEYGFECRYERVTSEYSDGDWSLSRWYEFHDIDYVLAKVSSIKDDASIIFDRGIDEKEGRINPYYGMMYRVSNGDFNKVGYILTVGEEKERWVHWEDESELRKMSDEEVQIMDDECTEIHHFQPRI